MRAVTLLTVPHTGTKFTEGLLKDHGFVRYALTDNPLNKQNVIFGGHLGPKERYEAALKAIERGFPLIIAMRHPFLVEKSWKGRNKPVKTMIEGFRQLDLIYREFKPMVMPVDSEKQREKCLKQMAKKLDLDLTTQWRPINISQSTCELKPADVRPSGEVQDLVKDMKLMKFYRGGWLDR